MAQSEHKGPEGFTDRAGQELGAHGTSLFPIGFYDSDLEHDRIPWHWHDDLEALIVLSGEITFASGRQSRTLSAGQGIFINADTLHSAYGNRRTPCRYHSLVFHPRLVGGGIDSVFWQAYLRPLIGSGLKGMVLDNAQPWHRRALEDIETAWREGAEGAPGYEFRVRAALSELVFLITRNLPQGRPSTSEKALRDGGRIKLMLRYIQQNYADEIGVADIARSAAVSESECLRCFRSTIGIPPIQYVQRYRGQQAAELLGSTDQKIAEIGALCGFQDISYFTRSFREIRGMTPGEYRRQAGR